MSEPIAVQKLVEFAKRYTGNRLESTGARAWTIPGPFTMSTAATAIRRLTI